MRRFFVLKLFLLLFAASTFSLDAEQHCLAQAIFYEAGSESFEGKLAVAHVINNRKEDERFPESYCEIVYQKNQFSWVKNKKYQRKHRITEHDWRWIESQKAAIQFQQKNDNTQGALFFHERRINPKWKFKKINTIGNHVFYK